MRRINRPNGLAAAAAALLSVLCVGLILGESASAQLTRDAVNKPQRLRKRNVRDGPVFTQRAMVSSSRKNLEIDYDKITRSSSDSALSINYDFDFDISEATDTTDAANQQQSSVCKSIIAVGEYRISEIQQQPQLALVNDKETNENGISFDSEEMVATDESFVCELEDGFTVPIEGTDDQISQMRTLLNSGSLVSAQSTVEVNVNKDIIEDINGDIAAIGDGENLQQPVVTLPPGPVNIISNESNNSKNQEDSSRRLANYEGTKKVLVVRVTDIDGRSVNGNADYVSNKFFGTSGDKMTMKSGFDACSHGKFTVTNNYEGQVDTTQLDAPGVVDVTVNIRLNESSQATVREASLRAVKQKLGLSVLPGPFDYVVLVVEDCYRVGTESCQFAAYAYVNHWLSVFRADYYKYPAVQMHEIGHNLNLAHSGGLDGQTYTDHTCLMGNPLFSDDIGNMCFNPAKSYQISRGNGWYEDSNIIEFDSSSSTSWSGKIIGVAEYNNNPSNYPIVIKLETGTDSDMFVGFNRATGANADNVQGDDQVTIYRVSGGNGFGYSTSSLKGLLPSGQTFFVSNWRNTGSNLVITVNEINTLSSPGYAQVDITFGGTGPPPGPSPGPSPGGGFSFSDWLASLPPGLAISVLLLGILLLCTLLCVCYNKRKSSAGKRRARFDEELYSGESLSMKDGTNLSDVEKVTNARKTTDLSYVGKAVHSVLQRDHHQHHRTMWNVTSGRVIGQVQYTPRDAWDSSSDPGKGHSDWFPEKIDEIIGRTEAWCDVMTLGKPDGKFLTSFQSALQKLADRSRSKADPIVVRIMMGNYPAKPVDCDQVLKTLTKNLPRDANLHIWVGAWRKGLSWNHAKLVAVDGKFLHTGGHNMWEEPYLMKNPVHDLSIEMEGNVAKDGHLFADQQWKFIKDKQRTFVGLIIDKLPDALPLAKRTRVTVSEWPNDASVFPPQFAVSKEVVNALPQSQIIRDSRDVPLISIGRQGSMVSRNRPSDDAILAMITSSQSVIRMVLQDLGPVTIPGTKKALPGLTWPKEYLSAIGNAIYTRGVDVELVLSNPRSTPGGVEGKKTKVGTPYGNGWDCVDVAAEIVKAIQREHSSVDDAKLRAMITDNLRIAFIRHDKTSTYSDGNSIGLHSKHLIFDDRTCYIGSQNLYDCDLAEYGIVIDDEDEVGKILQQYFEPMWRSSYTPGLDVNVERVMDGLNVNRDGDGEDLYSTETCW